MNIIDCHSHSKNSPDAESTVDEMIEAAIQNNLSAYAITDHCEINHWFSIEHYGDTPNEYDTYDFGRDFEISMRENMLAKEKYCGKINFINGIELGQATHDLGLADSVVSDKRLDFVIGSMHQLKGYEDFAFLDYTKTDIPDALEKNFLELLKLCKWGKFDVLGHLTYTLRYIEGENGIKVNMTPYEEIIRECFKTLIQNGKGIEINTSGLRQKFGNTFPDLYYVKMFREMGGEILSIGSDSHIYTDVGKGVKEGSEIALQAGFKRLCYFKNRKPEFININ